MTKTRDDILKKMLQTKPSSHENKPNRAAQRKKTKVKLAKRPNPK